MSITSGSGGPLVAPPAPSPTPYVPPYKQVLNRSPGGATGVLLANTTPTLGSWTAPNDGQTHVVTVTFNQLVQTSAEVGGQIQIAYTSMGSAQTFNLMPGGAAVGFTQNAVSLTVDPGTTVNLNQVSGATGGPTHVQWTIEGN